MTALVNGTRNVTRVLTQGEILDALSLGDLGSEEIIRILLHLMRHTARSTPGTLQDKIAAIKAETYRL